MSSLSRHFLISDENGVEFDFPRERIPAAEDVSLDGSTGRGYSSTDLQSALEELRDHTVYVPHYLTTSTNGTYHTDIDDQTLHIVSGTATGFSIVLPDATSIPTGSVHQIANISTNVIYVKTYGGAALLTIPQNAVVSATLADGTTAAGIWLWFLTPVNTTIDNINYNVISTTAFSTTSATDVPVTSFTVTPVAGTYAVWVSSTNTNTTNNAVSTFTLYKAGVGIADTARSFQTGSSNAVFLLATQTVLQVDGTQAVAAYVKTSSGTLAINGRSMILIRLGA